MPCAASLANLLPPWTSEQAREAGRKGGRAKADKPKPVIIEPKDENNPRLVLIAEQIKRTRDLLNDDSFRYCEQCERGGIEPHHRAQLLKALDALLERERILDGQPLPGTLKPRQEPAARRQSLPDPTPIQPSPAQPQPAPGQDKPV